MSTWISCAVHIHIITAVTNSTSTDSFVLLHSFQCFEKPSVLVSLAKNIVFVGLTENSISV